jgi:hypothetical protein
MICHDRPKRSDPSRSAVLGHRSQIYPTFVYFSLVSFHVEGYRLVNLNLGPPLGNKFLAVQ